MKYTMWKPKICFAFTFLQTYQGSGCRVF